MTAIPIPPASRLGGEPEGEDDKNLFPVADIKKSLIKDFATPLVVKKRVSRLSQNYQDITSECMKVYLRLRPFTEEEIKIGEDKHCMTLSEDRHILTHTAPKDSNMFKVSARGIGGVVRHYTFTKIFDSATQQKEFFEETTQPLVRDFIEGENALIFTYGVTNAGKTYTIQGNEGNEGILPRSIELLFKSVGDKMLEEAKFKIKMAHNLYVTSEEERKTLQGVKAEILRVADEILKKRKSEAMSQQSSSRISESPKTSEMTDLTIETVSDTSIRPQSLDSTKDITLDSSVHGPVKYAIFVSFVEIYKELIYDLLVPVPDGKKEHRTVLRLGDDRKGVPYVRGMREIQVNSEEEVMKILAFGRQNLHVAATKLNKDSSRSHCVFTLSLVQVMDIPEPHGGRVSKISFCDLAGSERTNKTREEGDRLKEASKINTSLMNLGMCLDALRNNQKRAEKQHQRVVPFRESRLTRLFQNFFCGQGRACMVVNANMCASSFDETAHAMKFSAIAQEVQVIAKPMKKSRSTLFEEKFERMMEARKNPRATIAWERTPLKEEKEEEEAEEQEEQEEESASEEEGSESDDEPASRELDVAYWKNREKKYRDIIERMKQLLTEERKKNKDIEMTIRNEVAQSHENHIVQIEEHHEERLEETIEILEEEQQKRLQIMARLKDLSREELKEEMEKKQWELAVKHTNAEKKLEETEELLKSKISELQMLEEKVTSSETETNMIKMDMQKKDEELVYLRRKVERNRRSSSVLDENQFIEDLQKEIEEGRNIIKSLMEENEEHRGRVEEVEEENDKLKSMVEDIRKKNKELDTENMQTSDKIDVDAGKSEELEKVQNELDKLKESLKEVQESKEAEVKEKTAKLEKVNSDFGKLQNENGKLQKEVEELKSELESLQRNGESLENDFSSAKVKHAKLEDEVAILTRQVASLQEESKKKDENVAEALKEKDELFEKNGYFREKHDEMKASMLATESSLSKVKNKITDLTGKLNKSEETTATLKTELATEREKCAKFEEENSRMKSSLTNAENSSHGLEEKLQELTEGRKGVQLELSKVTEEYEKGKSENEKLNARLAEVEASLEEAKSKAAGLCDEIRQKEKDILKLKESAKTAEGDRSILAADLKTQQEAFAAEKKVLEDQLKNSSETSKKLEASQEDVEKLKKDLREAKNFEGQMVKETDRMHSTVEKLQKENAQVKQTLEKGIADSSKLKEEINVLTMERNDLLEKSKNADKELNKVTKEKEALETRLRDNIANNTSVQSNTELEKLRTAMMEMDKTQTEQEKVIDEFESEKTKLMERKKDLETKIAETQKNLQDVREENEKILARSSETQKKLQEELEGSRTQLKKDHQKEAKALNDEIKHLKAEVKTVEKSKETEMKNFRDNRDRIVEALQEQINNQKSTNNTLKENLDEAMRNNVKLQSQNAQYMAENKKLKEKEEGKGTPRAMRQSVSASAILVPKLVRVKDEPMSPEPEQPKRRKESSAQESDEQPQASAAEKSGEDCDERDTPEEAQAAKEPTTAKRAPRRTKSGSSTSTRSTKRTKRAPARPATPLPEQHSDDDKDSLPSPRKSRRTGRGKKSSVTSVKVEASAEGVLDDSELLRETGNSQMFPQSTMELDVTPQLSKKTTRTRKRTAKYKDEEQSSEADDGVFRTKSTRRGRPNKNNNNASNPSEEEEPPAATSGLTRVGGMIKNSPVGQAFKRIEAAITPTSKSPAKARTNAEDAQVRQSKRGKKKLHADDISLPLEATPSPDEVRHGRVVSSTHLVSATPSRMMRRLRNRK